MSAAVLNAISDESTACDAPSLMTHAHADDREADAAAPFLIASLEALLAGRDELARDRAADDVVDELVVSTASAGSGSM